MKPALPLLALSLLLGACAKENATAGARRMEPIAPTRSDSAGVAMMVHGADAFEQAPDVKIDTMAVVTMHGSADNPDDDISTVEPVLFLADGRLIGIDRQRQQVMVFSADGGTRVAFGRKGNGPGEFGFITGIVRAGGDSLLVIDPGNGRATMLSPSTGLGAEYPLGAAMGGGSSSAAALVGHKLLLWGMNFSGSDQPPGVKAVVLDLQEDVAEPAFTTGPDTTDQLKPREVKTAGGAVLAMRAVSIKPLMKFPEAFGWQGHYVVADGNHLRFEIRDLAGKVIGVLRIDRPRVAVTDGIWQAYIDDQVRGWGEAIAMGGATVVIAGGGGGGPDTAAMRERLKTRDHADSLPAYSDVKVTPDGTMWVVDYPVPGESGWGATAITTDGRILGRLVSPTGSAPVAYGDDRVAFRTEDDLGIATITIRRISFFK